MLKNIIFDFGNVIIKYDPDDILDHYALTTKQHRLLKKIIFASPEWLQIDAGQLSEEQATKIFLKRVPAALKGQVRDIMATWPQKVIFYPQVQDLMQELKQKGYGLYALSNTGMRFAHYLQETAAGSYFDGYILSAAEKLVKPDPKIFQLLLSRYHLAANQCLFIDDQPNNTAAAEKLGLHGFTFHISDLPQLEKEIRLLSKK